VEFRILGPLEIVEDGEPLALPTGKAQRALLLYLLLHANEVVSVERLIDAVWPEHAPATAAKIVQGYVSHWRKCVGTRLETRAPGYVLRVEDGELDAARAQALGAEARVAAADRAAALLREALALWRGSPLVDVGYEPFAQPEIARLDELRASLLEQRIDADLRLGRHDDVVGELEALVARHPLRERLRAHLMLALYRSGRQADALAAYGTARRTFVGELGLEPGEELQALQRAILAHDASLDMPVRGDRPARPRRRPRRRTLAAAAALLVLGAAAAAAFTLHDGDARTVAVLPNSVAVVDPERNVVVANVPVGVRPTALATTGDAVWVANADDGTVTKIDARTRKPVATIGIGGDVSDLAVGFGSVWVADGNAGTVTRIDPHQNLVTRTLSFGRSDPLVPEPVFLVAIGGGVVWVSRGDELLRIDPRTNDVVTRRPVPPAYGLTVAGDDVWATTFTEQLLRLDARTGEQTAAQQFASFIFSPVVGGGWLWASLGGSDLAYFDPETAALVGTIPLHGRSPAVTWGDGAVWICDDLNHRLLRVERDTNRITASIRLVGAPADVVTGHGLVWVAVQAPIG